MQRVPIARFVHDFGLGHVDSAKGLRRGATRRDLAADPMRHAAGAGSTRCERDNRCPRDTTEKAEPAVDTSPLSSANRGYNKQSAPPNSQNDHLPPPDLVNKSIKQAVCDDFVWSENREWLTSHRVFHSIRFKVNKVGIQWYPIFFALHLGLIGKQPLFFSPSPICAPARPAVCRGVASVCATTEATGLLPAGRRRGATHRKGHVPIAPLEWCLATETTAVVR